MNDEVIAQGHGDRDRSARLLTALGIVRMRSMRDRMLGQRINFADPAWDLLLDLYVAELRGHRLSVSDACVGARVPATTALRWLNHLQAAGAIERVSHPRDKRRVMLQLTSSQVSLLDDFFDALIASTSSTEASWKRSSNSPSA